METKQKSKKMLAILVLALALALMACPAKGSPDSDWIISGNNIYSGVSGNVGIGTTNPTGKLHIDGPPALRIERNQTGFEDTIASIGISSFYGPGGLRFQMSSNDGVSWQDTLFLTEGGNVGIGTTMPESNVHICEAGDGCASLRLEGNREAGSGWANAILLYAPSSPAGPNRRHFTIVHANPGYPGGDNVLEFRSTNDDGSNRVPDILTLTHSGNVGIGTTSPAEKLTVRGNLLIESSDGTDVVELGAGLDYAEGFDVTEQVNIKPGMVLVIDSDNPGSLTVSRSPYDSRVAGIVAGGKGLASGVRLGADEFDCDVALAGRVYCNVDTSNAGIKPGDLLTTSSRLGYAMKASDQERSHGAILGKAMESLEKGKKGQILVLVTLQ